MRRRGRRVARLPAVIPRPASILDQTAISKVASMVYVSCGLWWQQELAGRTEEVVIGEGLDKRNANDNC
jgi:hypothetical protein